MLDPVVSGAAFALSAAGAAVAAYGTFVAQSGLWGTNTTRSGSNRLCLTFDDGPSPGFTDQVLEILVAARVPAAFFVIGVNVRRNPDLLRQVHAAGHAIGNHSYDHHHFGMMRGRRYWIDQLRRTDDAVAEITGQRPVLFRPPMGFKTPLIMSAMRHCGHRLVTWSVRGLDGVATSPERLCQRITARTRPGDILTLHDGVDPHCNRTPGGDGAVTADTVAPVTGCGV